MYNDSNQLPVMYVYIILAAGYRLLSYLTIMCVLVAHQIYQWNRNITYLITQSTPAIKQSSTFHFLKKISYKEKIDSCLIPHFLQSSFRFYQNLWTSFLDLPWKLIFFKIPFLPFIQLLLTSSYRVYNTCSYFHSWIYIWTCNLKRKTYINLITTNFFLSFLWHTVRKYI